jgi:predicted NBD/HSP70 family sugar kinase
MPYIIGLDIGGTKIEGILVNSASVTKVIKSVRLPTSASKGKSAVLKNIVSVIEQLFSYGKKSIKGFKLKGIGIGIAGFLKEGRMELAPNISCLEHTNFRQELQLLLAKKGIRANIFIENDSVCFTLAEWKFGAARGCKNLIGLIVGTGVGGGLICSGRLCIGRDGAAGHIGHMFISPGQKCGCGMDGHFEAWCSGKHMTRRYVDAGGKISSPDPAKIFNSNEAIARQIMAETYEKFGQALGSLINVFNPEVIVMGGGLSNLPKKFYTEIMATANSYAYPALISGVKLKKNSLGDSAGVFGAAELAN